MSREAIRVTFTAALVALPRGTQLTHETIVESWERRPGKIGPRPERRPSIVCSDGTEQTWLRFHHANEQIEVAVSGAALPKALDLKRGDKVRVIADLRGSHPHYRLHVERASGLKVVG